MARAARAVPRWQEASGGAAARIEELEGQVDALLAMADGQAAAAAELLELRPKFAALERKLRELEGEEAGAAGQQGGEAGGLS
mmetsp:Transcript_41392/g.109238  ORF Transcript_41392/g.109238 Transcript_41392/m.109238 type:complete len:83 (+) Transcript_41392:77-325(+)